MQFLRYLKSQGLEYSEENNKRLLLPFELKGMDEETTEDKEMPRMLKVKGYGSIHSAEDLDGDVFPKSAYDFSFFKENPIMSYNHKDQHAECIIGRFLSWKMDEKGLMLEGEVDPNPATPEAKQVVRNMRHGFVKAFSIGAYVQWKGSRREGIAERVILFDASVVVRPAGITEKGSPFFEVSDKNYTNAKGLEQSMTEALKKARAI